MATVPGLFLLTVMAAVLAQPYVFFQQFPDNGFSPWPPISLTPGMACLFFFGQKYKFGALEQTQYLKYEEGRLERGATARAVELCDSAGRRD